MKRILFFNDTMAVGGTEVILVNLLNHLATRNCVITLLLPQPSRDNVLIVKLSQAITVKYISDGHSSHLMKKLNENLMIFLPSFFNNCRGIKEQDYDEVVCFKECFYARLFSKWSIPKVLWIHNILYRRQYDAQSLRERLSVWLNKKQLRISQRSYDRYNKVICVSDACKSVYIDILHNGTEPHQDITVLYNAIDVESIIKQSKEPIDPLPQDITKFILLTRNSPEKRIDRLLNVVTRLNRAGYKLRVYVLGEGISETILYNAGLDDIVTFLGHVDNPFPYIVQCNWMVCVSERESFSLALLEAMTLKTPVITTDCGGPSNIVEGGKYGILVDNSTEGIYEGMKKVLDDPQLSVQYSAHLDEAIERYDYDGWLKSVESLLSV